MVGRVVLYGAAMWSAAPKVEAQCLSPSRILPDTSRKGRSSFKRGLDTLFAYAKSIKTRAMQYGLHMSLCLVCMLRARTHVQGWVIYWKIRTLVNKVSSHYTVAYFCIYRFYFMFYSRGIKKNDVSRENKHVKTCENAGYSKTKCNTCWRKSCSMPKNV